MDMGHLVQLHTTTILRYNIVLHVKPTRAWTTSQCSEYENGLQFAGFTALVNINGFDSSTGYLLFNKQSHLSITGRHNISQYIAQLVSQE